MGETKNSRNATSEGTGTRKSIKIESSKSNIEYRIKYIK